MVPLNIIDASIALKWYIKEEYSYNARLILNAFISQEIEIIEPSIMTLEVMNGLLWAMLSKRIKPADTRESIESFFSLNIPEKYIAGKIYCLRIFDLAQKHKLSIYDCSYIILAESLNCNFITADKKLYDKLKGKLSFVKFIADFK